jgi:hypothetical protein
VGIKLQSGVSRGELADGSSRLDPALVALEQEISRPSFAYSAILSIPSLMPTRRFRLDAVFQFASDIRFDYVTIR